MTLNSGKEVAALERMTVGQLRERYAERFNETTQARNRTWLIRRIIWRMQSLQQGGLSERAIRQANELANGADLRVTAPRGPKLSSHPVHRTKTVACQIELGSRVPLPGTVNTRRYKGRLIHVKVTRKFHIARRHHGRKQLRDGSAPDVPTGRVPRIARLMALAIRCDQLIRDGVIAHQSELAEFGHITTARKTQIMVLLNLAATSKRRFCCCLGPSTAATW